MRLFGKKKKTEINQANGYLKLDDLNGIFGIIVLDTAYEVVSVNDKMLIRLSLSSDELIGKSINTLSTSIIGTEFHDGFWIETLAANFFSNQVQVLNKESGLVSFQLKVVKSSEGFFTLLFDEILITEKHEEIPVAPNLNNELFLELIKQTPDIICFKDGEGKWLLANEADLKLFHLEKVKYFGKTDADLANETHPMYKSAFSTCMQTDKECWEQKKISRRDEIIPLTSGDEAIYDVFKIPVFNEDGSRKNLIVLGRDVTARRLAEKELVSAKLRAEESDRLKSAFLATMSHELRTPLNAVIGFANLIFDEEDLVEIRDYSRIINNNSNVLLNLIEDIFDISLIESGQMQVLNGEFDVVKAINEVYEIFPVEISMLDKMDIDFKLNIQAEGILIDSDVFRFKQILMNLVRNALKFTEKGFIHISFKALEDTIEIEVKDSGIGISKDKLEQIFEIFEQGETGYNRKFGGAGLGLSISKKLAIILGGDIRVTSNSGLGSTFILSLPR
ncbi:MULTISPECIES: PAS domain-containing sensor histidine kinase [unclassified Lentimicrobium]|uniref:PAS domain-containing sensor histidine kinase n=1 Tax=unclassified Lentimicrobium TaxID=2677434 RepID=UPI0015572F8C|nr:MULTISPECIES: ATP-binding protein [unclassified Lentimicrobium]NPD45484.1 PAS domain-containing protein [Lentimicrobium sp. S6]NPD83994.1 PAS domain-containing protein [Lentimicrobium sp. L6]